MVTKKKLISKPYGIYTLVSFIYIFINVLYTHLYLLELFLFTKALSTVNTQLCMVPTIISLSVDRLKAEGPFINIPEGPAFMPDMFWI